MIAVPRVRLLVFFFFCALADPAAGQVTPDRSRLWVRLETPVESKHAAAGNPVEAVVLETSEDGVIPIGSRILGSVASISTGRPNTLRLNFDSVIVGGRKLPLKATVAEVDNARETVRPDGTIVGLGSIRKRPGNVELVLLAAAYAHPAAIVGFEFTKLALHEFDRPEIRLRTGTDLTLSLDRAPAAAVRAPAAAPPDMLAALLTTLPNRTTAKHELRPSDWINLAFVAGKHQLQSVFAAAGWEPADSISMRSDVRVFFAIAKKHAYETAPVSTLLLMGREPDLVFQKQNNTFAKRHHIRIWSAGVDWEGRAVWIASATHDIGITFSRQAHTFSHRVESDIDLERAKVIRDLTFTGRVANTSFLPRSIPATSRNATGDRLVTDGRLAILMLADSSPK